jgi:hypothetical protein
VRKKSVFIWTKLTMLMQRACLGGWVHSVAIPYIMFKTTFQSFFIF